MTVDVNPGLINSCAAQSRDIGIRQKSDELLQKCTLEWKKHGFHVCNIVTCFVHTSWHVTTTMFKRMPKAEWWFFIIVSTFQPFDEFLMEICNEFQKLESGVTNLVKTKVSSILSDLSFWSCPLLLAADPFQCVPVSPFGWMKFL